jgi:hypothetical protein
MFGVIGGFRKVFAKMCSSRLFASQSRSDHHTPEVKEIAVFEIVDIIPVSAPAIELINSLLEACSVALDTGM